MSDERKLWFSVSDEAGGLQVAPEAIPLGLLKEFVADVAAFIRGSDGEIETKDLIVSVKKGSFGLQSHEALPAALSIWSDLDQLAESRIDGVDARRVAVAEKWRAQAIRHPTRSFNIGDSSGTKVVLINANTFFLNPQKSYWVKVERYVAGVIVDWGGMASPNMHLRLDDGTPLTIAATHDQIREQEKNLVYHHAVVRVEMEEDFLTGEKRNVRFLGFADYDPKVDEDQYQKMIRLGREAWKDIDDSVNWVRSVRGGDEG